MAYRRYYRRRFYRKGYYKRKMFNPYATYRRRYRKY